MKRLMNYTTVSFLVVILVSVSSQEVFSKPRNTFNQLILTKGFLESKYGVRSVECFPFKNNIGFTENQILLIKDCLAGIRLLSQALHEVDDPQVDTIGISTRFLRTGGFNTLLIPWDASLQETITFMKNKISKEQQDKFLDKIVKLKRKINRRFRIASLYCSQRISNDQCMTGYERLAAVQKLPNSEPTQWEEVVLDSRHGLGRDSHSYRIKYNASPKEILEALQKDPKIEWSFRKKMYADINSRYKAAFERNLKISSYYCSTELTEKNCLDGMDSLSQISENQEMRMKPWGEVIIDKHNTFIKDDFNVSIRFDLPADELVNYFLIKENRVEATENAVLAEKLEKRTLNNSSGLRAVCDLEGMRSKLCAEGFRDFIKFISDHRDFRVREPWTNIMFIDGTKLARLNFALNSPTRHSYIYIDAGGGPKALQTHLAKFKK